MDPLSRLETALESLESAAIAFSGGVDSAFLAAVAKERTSVSVAAVTVVSKFMSKRDIDHARHMAHRIGIHHVVVAADLLALPEIWQNGNNRCYYCKKQIFSLIKESAAKLDKQCIIHGANRDDLNDYRPGFKAALEMNVKAPLVDAGFDKEMIRRYSKKMGLETWDIPSQSCLATRIPYGIRITSENLSMVEQGEAVLQDLGFDRVRVRCHDMMARLEVDAAALERILQYRLKEKIVKEFKKIGFLHTALDLEGYVSGKMNRKV